MSRSNAVRVFVASALLCILSPFDKLHAAEDSSWTYQSNAPGLRSIARSIELTEDRPQDLEEDIAYEGAIQRYAQLRYGSENSRRVVIVVDELTDGQFAMYADVDRDRRISSRDLVEGTGRSRTFELETEIVREDQADAEARIVRLRLGATRTRMSVATLGCMEGTINWTDQDTSDNDSPACRVRRIDGDANGLFADARDRLLIDTNGDGNWDPIDEQFAYVPVLIIQQKRYAVRSDRLGQRLSLSEISGVGQLRVVVEALPENARINAFEAMVFSEDGSAYSLKEPDQPQTVPVGRYTLGSVTLTIDTGEREPWHFVFSRSSSVGSDDWVSVRADQDVPLEAVGKTDFVLNTKSPSSVRPGDAITVNPRLYTQDGLLINLSCRGRQMGSFSSERYHNRCDIKLATSEGDTISSAQSGFA